MVVGFGGSQVVLGALGVEGPSGCQLDLRAAGSSALFRWVCYRSCLCVEASFGVEPSTVNLEP